MSIAGWLKQLVGASAPRPAGDPAATPAVARESDPSLDADDDAVDPAPVELPIDGTLDLHTFAPAEVKDLLPAYLEACAARGIRVVRVVHGKGRGQLKRTVEALLARQPLVAEFHTADPGAGGWGATLVTLRLPAAGSDR